MFGFDEAKDKRDEVYSKHESHFSHEVIAGGVAFEAMKKWEDHQRSEGKVVNHSLAKEVLMGIAGAEFDKFAETKGMDFVDREKAKHKTKEQAEHLYERQYGGYDNFDPNQMNRHESMRY